MLLRINKDFNDCDGICETCQYCLYDNAIDTSCIKKKTCNTCEFLKKLTLKNGKTAFLCNKYSSLLYPSKKKVVVYDKPEGDDIDTPLWCPLIDKTKLSYPDKEKLWRTIKPLTTIDDIKEGNFYHIPPINGLSRKDVYIIKKFPYSFEYREKNKNYNCIMNNNDLAVNFMSEIKV
jgi:hypothetical protein